MRQGVNRGMHDVRSQTALEYILLIAAVVLFVIIAALIIRTQLLPPATNRIANNATTVKGIINSLNS